MCVIIQRDPGITLDFEDILSAVHVNHDGWGFLINDRGKFHVEREYNPLIPHQQTAETIYTKLEEAKDCRVALHLRFNTAGDTNVENCHPYRILSEEEDGVDCWFMHNGTISEFKSYNEQMSDSYNFGQVILRPMLSAALAKFGPEEYLKQPHIAHIMKTFKGTYSAFTLNDSMGGRLILPSNQSKEHEGWWSSNTYSFDRYHREPTRTYGGYPPLQQHRNQSVVPFRTETNNSCNINANSTSAGTSTGKTSTETATKPAGTNVEVLHVRTIERQLVISEALEEDAQRLKDAVRDFMLEFEIEEGDTIVINHEGNHKPSFLHLAGLENHKELLKFDYDALYEMTEEFPEMATILITELLIALYGKDIPATPVIRKAG